MKTTLERIVADDPLSHSADLRLANLSVIRRCFPEVVSEDGVNVDVLNQLIGRTVSETEEKFGLSWNGKRQARQLSLTPSTATLRPCPSDSVDWDSTGNIVIEGENLEVLKLLQKSYASKVKLIYIDPPYNTGRDFVYRDNYRDNVRNYLELTGQIGEGGLKVSSNTEASGRFHTDWLNMMYPRLKLAKQLLKADGLICVSIDDNEEAALRFLLDEIFGEENRLSTLVWHLGTGPTAGHFLRSHEMILCYARDKSNIPNFVWRGGGEVVASALKRISAANPPSDIRFPAGMEIDGGGDHDFPAALGGVITQTTVDGCLRFRGGKLVAPVTLRAGWAMKTQIESWVSGRETYDSQGQRLLRLFFSQSGMLMYEKERTVIRPRTVLTEIASTADGSADIELCGLSRRVFDFPKPVALIKTLVSWMTDPASSDLVMDFFAGSGTTAHAVISQNCEDGGNRRFLCVQFPEPLLRAAEIDGHAHLTTISDALRHRVRGAAKALATENALFRTDSGFRSFKLASSNIAAWDPRPDDLSQSLFESVDHVRADRTEVDILYELLLKLGLELTVPIETTRIAEKEIHSVGAGVLMVCLATRITEDEVEPLTRGIGDWRNRLAPAGDTTCIFRDSAFENDVAKTNTVSTLEQLGFTSVRSL